MLTLVENRQAQERNMAQETEVMAEVPFCRKYFPEETWKDVHEIQYDPRYRHFHSRYNSQAVAELPSNPASVEVLVLESKRNYEHNNTWGYATLIGPKDKIAEIERAEIERCAATVKVSNLSSTVGRNYELRPQKR